MVPKGLKRFNSPERYTILVAVFVLLMLGVGMTLYGLQLNRPRPNITVSECSGQQSEDFGCWRNRYQAMVTNQSPEIALADAGEEYKQSQYMQRVCHQVTHVIGRAASKKYKDLATAYQHGTELCASGYYHGVIEDIANQIGTKRIISQINQICPPLNKDGSYKLPYYNCVHGLGHGLMAIYQNELFTSLEGCAKLKGNWEQNSCYSGVFMENIVGAVDPNSHSDYIKPDDPVYPCNAVAEKYKQACYHYQTAHMVTVYRYDFAKVFEECQRAGPTYSNTCYGSLGRDISGYVLTDAQKTKDACMLGQTAEALKYCIAGAVKDFVWQHGSLEKGLTLCRLLEGEHERDCNATAESYFALYQ